MAEQVKTLRPLERPVCVCGNSARWRMLLEPAEAQQLKVWPLGRRVSLGVQCDACGKTAQVLFEVAMIDAPPKNQ